MKEVSIRVSGKKETILYAMIKLLIYAEKYNSWQSFDDDKIKLDYTEKDLIMFVIHNRQSKYDEQNEFKKKRLICLQNQMR